MKLTKGFIRNNVTSVIKPFMYNPTAIQYKRGATYSETSAPGSPYPRIAFVKGDVSSIPLKLFLTDRPQAGAITEFIDFLNGFFPEENSSATFKKPVSLTVSLGHIIRVCVLISMTLDVLDYSNTGIPTRAEISLDLKVVA